jgi:hypothetical protein
MDLELLKDMVVENYGNCFNLIGATFLDENNKLHVLFDKSGKSRDITEYKDLNIFTHVLPGKVKIYYI